MADADPSQIAGYASGGAAMLLALAYSVQRFFRTFRADSAEGSIVSLLREEVLRMAAQTREMAEEMKRLQSELIQLNKQLITLNTENNQLRDEVTYLTNQVRALRSNLEHHKPGI